MHTHGIKVLNGANDNAITQLIAHDFHLELFPALDGFLN